MLVLSRRVGEQIRIAPDIVVTIVKIEGNRIRLGIEAPGRVVLRGEVPPRELADASELLTPGLTDKLPYQTD